MVLGLRYSAAVELVSRAIWIRELPRTSASSGLRYEGSFICSIVDEAIIFNEDAM